MKTFIGIVLGLVIGIAGMYLMFTNSNFFDEEAEQIPTPDQSTDLFDMAKNSGNYFTYLVTATDSDSEWRMVLNDSYLGAFSFEYSWFPWSELRYMVYDLTAVGMPGDDFDPNSLSGDKAYWFCAGNYYCNLMEKEGMGFELTFWNAEYLGRADNPEFYLKDGNIFLMETDEHIVTYRPFDSSDSSIEIGEAVSLLISSFEFESSGR